MKKLFILILCGIALQLRAQQFHFELYGFKLGQYRDATYNELGKPIMQNRFDDGFLYEVFLLKPDSSMHIVFEYAPNDTNAIWSVQVAGTNTVTETGLKNLKLGMDKKAVEAILGTPASKVDVGEYGFRWEYANSNLSVEIDPEGKLSSIKISDNSHQLFPKPDPAAIPSFEQVRKILTTGTNKEILDLLCGNAELYYKGEVYTVEKSFKTEETVADSKLLALIRMLAKDLDKVNPKNEKEYEESMRLVLNEDIKHVMKLKGHTLQEIVLKPYAGKYLIYEINAEGPPATNKK